MTAKDKMLQLTPLLGIHTAKDHFLKLFNGIATSHSANIDSMEYIASINNKEYIANIESSDYTINISQPVYTASIQNTNNSKDTKMVTRFRGDTEPMIWHVTKDGAPMDCSNVQTAVFSYNENVKIIKLNGNIIDKTGGVIEFKVPNTAFTVAGTFVFDIQLTFNDGTRITLLKDRRWLCRFRR